MWEGDKFLLNIVFCSSSFIKRKCLMIEENLDKTQEWTSVNPICILVCWSIFSNAYSKLGTIIWTLICNLFSMTWLIFDSFTAKFAWNSWEKSMDRLFSSCIEMKAFRPPIHLQVNSNQTISYGIVIANYWIFIAWLWLRMNCKHLCPLVFLPTRKYVHFPLDSEVDEKLLLGFGTNLPMTLSDD